MVSEPRIIEEHIAPKVLISERLSEYARDRFEGLPSRKSVVKAIKRNQLWVNGAPSTTGYWVCPGDRITLMTDSSHEVVYKKELRVIYEDDFVAAIFKPGDLPVSGNMLRTVANALSGNLEQSSQMDSYSRPRPVHRLDRQTSGILIIAKTVKAASSLGAQFEDRTVTKSYRAIVQGSTSESFSIEDAIEGREAVTYFEKVREVSSTKAGILTELKCYPQTGRKNQIRIHLSNSGLPIYGDQRFGGERSGRGLLLFAEAISFTHPESGERIELSVDLPRKFERIMRSQKKRSPN